jgi:nickel/cobalt transporter (NicO) family protein
MYQIVIGSLILSTIHALIPNHWLPLIAVGKMEKWTQNQTLWATVITGFAHTLSTIIIGIVVGLIGYKLSSSYSVISETIAPSILIGLGIIYVILDFRSHNHHHDINDVVTDMGQKKSRWAAILTSLSIAMFLTPCIEIEAYYFQAGSIGWIGIFIVSASV